MVKKIILCLNNEILCKYYNFKDMKRVYIKKLVLKLYVYYNLYFMFINRYIYIELRKNVNSFFFFLGSEIICCFIFIFIFFYFK